MRFFAWMFTAIAILGCGFFLGVKYQQRADARGQMAKLVQVQKIRIAKLHEDALRLKTALMLRDYLEEVRVRLPRATYQATVAAIADASLRYDVPPETILAVIRIESTFDVDAISEAGAVGLMQILPTTAAELARELSLDWFGEDDLRDPATNIQLGTYYLTKLLGRFNDLTQALAAYNEGPARVADRARRSTEYTQRVLAYANP
jgi:soluble lytic murein transglycosylase-like protein